ncbi:MAG: peptide deformylase [Oscillospiraceae bacterium]|jgi:peptide deformylase|nr:peptide deformylase [Oscillospiraceae bacterium]
MPVLEVLVEGNEILTKKCDIVENFDEKLHKLLDDMKGTMYASGGVGLAAPQVGFLLRVIVIDVGDGYFEMINPKIVETEGEQRKMEGCLSCPGENGITIRPNFVRAVGFNRNGEPFEVSGKDLKARAICHEIDHLDGILFKQRLSGTNKGKSKLFWKK